MNRIRASLQRCHWQGNSATALAAVVAAAAKADGMFPARAARLKAHP